MPSTKRNTRASRSEPLWDVDGEMPRSGFTPDYADFPPGDLMTIYLNEVWDSIPREFPGVRLTGITEKI